MVKFRLGCHTDHSHGHVYSGKFIEGKAVHDEILDTAFLHDFDDIAFFCRIILQRCRTGSVLPGCTAYISGKSIILSASQIFLTDLCYFTTRLSAEINI